MLKPFKIISEKSILDIQKKYSVNEVELETPEGKTTTWKYIQGQKDIVVVLPLDAEHNVYLKQEWRLNRKDFAWEVKTPLVHGVKSAIDYYKTYGIEQTFTHLREVEHG